jgi:hypothetical protein
MLSQRAAVRVWKQVPIGIPAMIPGRAKRTGKETGTGPRPEAERARPSPEAWASPGSATRDPARGGFFPRRDVTDTRKV